MVGRRPRRPPSAVRLILIGGLVVAIVIAASSLSPRHLNDWDKAELIRLGIILGVGVLALAARTQPLPTMAKQATIWLALGAVLFVGYSYRDELNGVASRTIGTLVPSRGIETAPGIMRFSADDSGQFFVDAVANGVPIHFLVDTGASGIVLSQRDARRLGLLSDDLQYTARFSTANGTTRAAPVVLQSLRLESFADADVRAWINEGDLEESLLGMSYLSTLGRVEIRGGMLTLERRVQ